MLRKFILLTGVLMSTHSAFAQIHEFGIIGTATQYRGDLRTTIDFDAFQPGVGVWYKYNLNPYLGFKGGYYTTNLAASDANSTNLWQVQRNLNFSSYVSELFGLVEFNFLKFIPGHHKYIHSPYVYLGLSNFRFNPITELNGQIIELQPLGTEGQGLEQFPDREPYRLRAFALPIGIGYRVNFWRFHTLAVEASYRYALTDYIDDVSLTYAPNDVIRAERGLTAAQLADRSIELGLPQNLANKQRGVDTFNDAWWYVGVSYIYTINSGRCPRFR